MKEVNLSSKSMGINSSSYDKAKIRDEAIGENKVLIVKMSAIGDILHAFPIVSYIKQKQPGVQVDWLVEEKFVPIVASHPQVDRVIGVDTKTLRKGPISALLKQIKALWTMRYATIFDLQGNIKSGLMTFFIRAKEKVGFSRACCAEWPNSWVTNRRYSVNLGRSIWIQYASLVQQYYKDSSEFVIPKISLNLSQQDIERLKEGNIEVPLNSLMVCFGSNWENKRVKTAHLIALLKSIAREYSVHFIFVYGSPKEQEKATQLHQIFSHQSEVLGGLSIPLWQTIMAKCRGVITMDSAALHLASLVRVKTFAFFGPSSSGVYNPPGQEHAVYQGACPYGEKFVKRCKILRTCSTGNCLHEMNTEWVYQQIRAHFF